MPVGEMFFRAGGLSCINPIMETGLSVFNQALKYLELERTVNYGTCAWSSISGLSRFLG